MKTEGVTQTDIREHLIQVREYLPRLYMYVHVIPGAGVATAEVSCGGGMIGVAPLRS